MTAAELDCESAWTQSRVERIARGAGVSVSAVHLLLEEHKNLTRFGPNDGKRGISCMKNEAQQVTPNQQSLSLAVLSSSLLHGLGEVGSIEEMMKGLREGREAELVRNEAGGGGSGVCELRTSLP